MFLIENPFVFLNLLYDNVWWGGEGEKYYFSDFVLRSVVDSDTDTTGPTATHFNHQSYTDHLRMAIGGIWKVDLKNAIPIPPDLVGQYVPQDKGGSLDEYTSAVLLRQLSYFREKANVFHGTEYDVVLGDPGYDFSNISIQKKRQTITIHPNWDSWSDSEAPILANMFTGGTSGDLLDTFKDYFSPDFYGEGLPPAIAYRDLINSNVIQVPLKDAYGELMKLGTTYTDYNFKIDVPRKITPQVASNGNLPYAEINSIYNYYIKKYEDFMFEMSPPESVLPNLYILSLADPTTKFGEWDAEQLTSEGQLNVGGSSPFDKNITLNGNIFGLDLSLITTKKEKLVEYFKLYTDNYKTVTVDVTENIGKTMKNFGTTMSDPKNWFHINNKKHHFPMYNEIIFSALQKPELMTAFMQGEVVVPTLQKVMDNAIKIKRQVTDKTTLIEFNSSAQLEEEKINTEFQTKVIDGWHDEVINSLGQKENLTDTLTDDLFENIALINVNGEPGFDPGAGAPSGCLDLLNKIKIAGLKSKLYKLMKEKGRSYRDLVEGKLAYSEILFFRIEKTKTRPGAFFDEEPDLVQNFYIMNIPGLDVMEFVDTQVKYATSYTYTVHATVAVVGTRYKYVSGTTDWSQAPIPEYDPETGMPIMVGSMGALNVDVVYHPDLKILEVPYYKYEPVKVLDNAPLAPDVEFVPYKNVSNKIQIKLSTNTGEHIASPKFVTVEEAYKKFNYNPTGKNIAMPPISIFDLVNKHLKEKYGDNNEAYPEQPEGSWYTLPDEIPILANGYMKYSTATDGTIEPDPFFKVKFKSDGDVEIFQILRIDTPPTSYQSFANAKEILLEYPAGQTVFDDIITPNKKYYYMLRAVDVHGHLSNPSFVYEVEMVSDHGASYPIIKIYDWESAVQKETAEYKNMKKMVQIIPNLGHFYIDDENPVQSTIFNKTFKIRLTSKHTGKKLDLNVTFEKNKLVPEDYVQQMLGTAEEVKEALEDKLEEDLLVVPKYF